MRKDLPVAHKNGQVYAELLCDFMFKRLFGSEENKDVLIGFLNILMHDAAIVDVDFIPTEHHGMTEHDRKAVFDISCKCADGQTFIIEMQKGYQKHFRKRAVFYTSYPINEQWRLAREKFIREHEATDVLRFVFLELGRFKKCLWELESSFDKWMYLLKHMHEMDTVPDKFSTPEFKRLFILAKIGNFTAKEYEQYLQSMKDMSDYYNIIDTAAEEAEKRGEMRGEMRGKMREKMRMARKLLAMGMPLEQVSEATEMPIDEISALKEQ